MTPYLIDTHCHLHFPSYSPEQREQALLVMKEKNIWGITVGTSIRTSREAIAFAESHEGVFAAVGYHPEHLTSSFHDESEGPIDTFDIDALAELATSSPKVVGIGETGLDFFRIDPERPPQLPLRKKETSLNENLKQSSSYEEEAEGVGIWLEEAKKIQESVFRQQIQLACRIDKPIIIHSRDAASQLVRILRDEREKGNAVRGVMHCFTGTWEEAKPLLDLGLYLAFGGIITFPPKKTQDPETSVHRVIERMPIEKMLVETDAPWLTPVPHRGQQNQPAYVDYVAQKIAELRGIEHSRAAEITTQNAQQLFRI